MFIADEHVNIIGEEKRPLAAIVDDTHRAEDHMPKHFREMDLR
jgi:hypothetical protein